MVANGAGHAQAQALKRLDLRQLEWMNKEPPDQIFAVVGAFNVGAAAVAGAIQGCEIVVDCAIQNGPVQVHAHVAVRNELGGKSALNPEQVPGGLEALETDWRLEFAEH